jgi:hypothetical protein
MVGPANPERRTQMKIQAIASSVALAAAIAFASPVAAQEFMLRGETIPVDQVDNLKEACEGLRAANLASLTESDDSAIDPAETGSVNDDAMSTTSPDPAAQDKWLQLQATLTVEECEAAGFYAGR